MHTVLRSIFLAYFVFYVLSPLFSMRAGDEAAIFSETAKTSGFRLFILEYLLSADDEPGSADSSPDRILLRKKRFLTSSGIDKKLLPNPCRVNARIPDLLLKTDRTALVERNTDIVKPQKIFYSNHSSLSPPSL